MSREVAYRVPDVGVVTDIQYEADRRLTIAGLRGAAFVNASGTPVAATRYEECKSEVDSVRTVTNEGPYFLCRGGWIEAPKLFDVSGGLIWSLSVTGDGVDDSAAGDLGVVAREGETERDRLLKTNPMDSSFTATAEANLSFGTNPASF